MSLAKQLRRVIVWLLSVVKAAVALVKNVPRIELYTVSSKKAE